MDALKKIINWLRNHLTISETYTYYGHESDLVKTLYHKDLSGKPVGKKRFIFSPFISWGTMTGSFRSGIKVFLEYESITETEQKIRLYTNIRPEIWFITGVLSFILIAFIISGQDYKGILMVIVSFPVCVLWFNFIYKIQEESMITKVRKKLKLKA
jgi:hypothetical protein